jgi:hypothetical protein
MITNALGTLTNFKKKENTTPMTAFEVPSTCRRQDGRGFFFFGQFCDVAEEAIINNMI